MSPIGRWLLRVCSNDMRIDLKNKVVLNTINANGWRLLDVRLTAIHLGITIEGGS